MMIEASENAAVVSPDGKIVHNTRTPLIAAAWTIVHRWKGRILLALVDQGTASAANFLLTILCVIWLPLDQFGRYVIVMSISLLVEVGQASLVLDSMPAIVARYGQRNRRRLEMACLWVVMLYGALTSALILLSILFLSLWAPEFTVPLLCLAAANLFQRLYVFLRRLCYIRDRQQAAAVASIAYGSCLLGGVTALHQLGLLTVPSLVLLWGTANGLAALVICSAGVLYPGRTMTAHVMWLIRQLWRSGRWLVGAALGFWACNWGILPLVAAVAGVEAAGIVRALQNLVTPVVQLNAALNLAILPRVADKVVANGPRYARQFAIYSTAAFTALVVIYAAVVLTESETILKLLYRKQAISASAHLLWPLGIALIVEAAPQGSSIALLALNRTRIFFISRILGVAILLAGTLLLGPAIGTEGILWANAVSHAVGAALLMFAAFTIPDISQRVSPIRKTRQPVFRPRIRGPGVVQNHPAE
jgi:O-antigen/teichoic acid export membrane protein